MNGVITLGEALIDFIPLDKNNIKYKKNPGGAPANVAVGLSRLGAKSSFIGKVGDDVLGNFLKDTLANKGVNTDGMLLTDEARTGLVFVTLDEAGERSFSFYIDPSADTFLSKSDIKEEMFSHNKILHFGSISLINEPARSATKYAVKAAKKNEMLISYDPNLRLSLWDDAAQAKESIISMLAETDILKISEEELEFITGTQEVKVGVSELKKEYDIPLIYVTFGSKGAYYYYQEDLKFVPAMKVDTVDTTGAGDAFVSGILYNLNEMDIDISKLDTEFLNYVTEFASVSGALAASQKGAMSALPNLDKVEEIVKNK
ncbi:sugar kinase, ribokinase [Halobacteroides halobius DSM 5150]|uniref:Sugar kinase, ribokinase n=1 Tax=Halobacteroides halobius (strain ATCC 35273 / DSM 5150 / MD-1) TaxID=748449 RepID=L0K8E9_HALHC|nr:aminoimidazole riboside kinase [Halobacteroides halobius]AGB40800.1 sugar kinase, ribokinase [Halobacteroides halobius DSM 5150]